MGKFTLFRNFRENGSKYIFTLSILTSHTDNPLIMREKQWLSVNLYKIDVTGFKELKMITPADASDPAWSPIIP